MQQWKQRQTFENGNALHQKNKDCDKYEDMRRKKYEKYNFIK